MAGTDTEPLKKKIYYMVQWTQPMAMPAFNRADKKQTKTLAFRYIRKSQVYGLLTKTIHLKWGPHEEINGWGFGAVPQ